jgi:hypothetical protein
MILMKTGRGKIRLGRPRCRWEDDIEMHFKENTGRCGLVSSGYVLGLVAVSANTVMDFLLA